MDDDAPALLVTVSGPDRPGLTSALFEVLAPLGAVVLDLEQAVVRDRFMLGMLLQVSGDAGVARRALRDRAAALGLDLEDRPTSAEEPRLEQDRQYVTLMGGSLDATAVGAVTARIAELGADIERIHRLSRWPITALELLVRGAEPERLRSTLAREAAAQQVDVAVQRATLYRRARRLFVMDVDSTLVRGEVIELLADYAGQRAQVARVTEAAMRGELDFEQALRQRVAVLAGLPATVLDDVRRRLRLTPGARTLVRTLRRLGYSVGIVSGGFSQITDPLAAELGLDHSLANTLEVHDGHLTGGLVGPVVDRAGKARALKRFAEAAGVPMSQTVAVGDGANDLDMLAVAGLGIAFNAKPAVRQAADTAVSVPYLDAILFVLGITREEVQAADSEDPALQPTSASGPADTPDG